MHCMYADAVAAAPPAPDGTAQQEMEDIRRTYIALQRDLLLADAAKLIPGPGQVAVYVSVDGRSQATLQAVSLAVNGALVSQRDYSLPEQDALRRAGADRIYLGDLTTGRGSLAITFIGSQSNGKPYSQTAHLDITDTTVGRTVEFQLARTSTKGAPDIITAASP